MAGKSKTPATMAGEHSLQTEVWNDKDFYKQLRRIGKRGTIGHAVAREVHYAIECWKRSKDPELPLTHHGESRVAHAVKYDLRGHYRLIAYEHAGQRVLLFVGDHNEADDWLERHKGYDFTVSKNGRLAFVPVEVPGEHAERNLPVLPTASGPILGRLPLGLIDGLGLQEATMRVLEKRAVFESAQDPDMWDLIDALTYPNPRIKALLRETLAFIVAGDVDNAIATVNVALGHATSASENPDEFLDALNSGNNSDVLVRLSDLTDEQIRRAIESPSITEWMLFLHPDQKKLVTREFQGPARLLGVSGSGKTSVLVHRAVHLAQKYHGERVLILCLNASLRLLIEQLVSLLAPGEVRDQIEVKTVYDLCYALAKQAQPHRPIERLDPRSGEDLATCWLDFLEKAHARELASPILEALGEREDKVDPEAYLLDELIWVRSGFGDAEREEYLHCERTGRGILFPKYLPQPSGGERQTGPLPPDTRRRVLDLLKEYEEYMEVGGLRDDDGVSLLAFAEKDRVSECPELRARCVLVDEYQDCSTLELSVIASIPTAAVDGLFLCGDPVQKVLPKQHELKRAGIDIRTRGVILRKNYRNSRQILEAAFSLIKAFKDDAPLASNEILEPEYAIRDGSRPSLYECETVEAQIDLVFYLLDCFDSAEWGSVCVCSARAETLAKFDQVAKDRGIETQRLTGVGEVLGNGIKTATLENVKGYEFAKVFVLDLSDEVLPRRGIPYGERWRDAFQIYVAMTRARDELIMTFVYNRSILLAPLGDTVHEGDGSSMLNA